MGSFVGTPVGWDVGAVGSAVIDGALVVGEMVGKGVGSKVG